MRWFGREKQRQTSPIKQVERTIALAGYGQLHVNVQIDCLGAVCPRPQLMCMRALDQMRAGEVLELVVDNPSTAEAIPAMDMTLGSSHLITVRDEGCWRIYVRKDAVEAES
jgi:tRNA 2-thiouridine synthesizing protein A